MLVEPEALPRAIWKDEVLPRMAAFMGMHHAGVNATINLGKTSEEKQLILTGGVYPPQAEMSPQDWQVLVDYHLNGAPESLEEAADLTTIHPPVGLFRESRFGYRQHEPNTTLVQIDEQSKLLFVGDLTTCQLSVLNADLTRIQKIRTTSAPVHVEVREGDLWVTHIGSVNPSDLPSGGLEVFGKESDYFSTDSKEILSELRRPTHASYADIDRDDVTDILFSEYGNQLGAVSAYLGSKGDAYRRVDLLKEPGSMISHVRDFNSDGWMDLAVIHGQNREGIHIHFNQGNGQFVWSYALPVPAHFGSSSFSLYDFNGDGHLDVLATNGDNGDYRAIKKPFHGVRIYLNDGNHSFSEHYFFPMNGAYKALAEDFDLDGDLDIAAISMFPDFADRPEEGFVYLENRGDLQFRASSISGVSKGRWMCMDAGDLDGDGDKDIVLGSFIRGPSEVPPSFLRTWESDDVPGLVLWNQSKQPDGASEEMVKSDLEPASADDHFRLGVALQKQGREAEAIQHLGAAVRLDSENPKMHASFGEVLLGKGEIDQAIHHFKKALEGQPGNALWRNNLGVSFFQKREYVAAIKAYHQALKVEPGWVVTRNNLTNCLQELARKVMGQPFEIKKGLPDQATMHAALGNVFRDQGDQVEAARHFQWALDLNPSFPAALNNLAWIRATHPDEEMRDGAMAVELAERCCELTQYRVNGTLDTLAAAYAEVGRFEEAVRWQKKAIELAGQSDVSELRKQLELYKNAKPLRK